MLVGESSTFLALLLAVSLLLAWLYWREHRRARSMQAFFASVTHELRTPLTSIRLQAEAIAEGEQRAELARRLLEDSHRLESQIDKTLELARIEGGGPLSEQAIPLHAWLRASLEDIAAAHGAAPGSARARGCRRCRRCRPTPRALQMILRNLVENSVRHARVKPVSVRLTARSARRAAWCSNTRTTARVSPPAPGASGACSARGAELQRRRRGAVSGAPADAAHGRPGALRYRAGRGLSLRAVVPGQHMSTPSAQLLLLVEDERNVAETLVERLRRRGLSGHARRSVASARRAIGESAVRAGAARCRAARRQRLRAGARCCASARRRTAIMFLTAHASAEDRIRGLELGADDYVGKPFHFRELLLRIQNCLKRAQDLAQVPGRDARPGAHRPRAGGFRALLATVDGENVALTHKECAVLRLLAERVGKAVSRDEILDRAWSADEFPTSRTVDNFIVRLRKLVEVDAADPRVIRSIRGVGYLLTEIHRE